MSPTLDHLLRQRSRCTPDRLAYLFLADGEVEADRATWGELDRRAQRVAAALRRVSSPGDRALLLYPPGLDFIATFFGCLYAGVVAVPAYPPRPRRDQPRLRAIVADARPTVGLTAPSLLAGMAEIAAREPALGGICWLAPEREGEVEGGEPEDKLDLDAPAFLQYTSGSTALPKGVAVSHANLLHNERMIQEAFRLDESSVVVSWLPLYHDMGLIGTVLQPLHCGGSCVLMPPVAFLQRPRRWLEAVSHYRGTASGGPNFAFELCVRKIPPAEREGLDLASWRVAFNGAEPVRSETLERFAEAFAPCGFDRRAFFPCYGLAEATLLVSGARPGEGVRTTRVVAAALARNEVLPAASGDDGALALVSSGRPAAGLQALIVDPESRVTLPEGRVGEIWVSGPSVARFYWRNPEASESELRATLADGRGDFLRTGDLGFLRGGELYVTGRQKDLVILRGCNYYPQDLELTAERAGFAVLPGGAAAFSVDTEGEERLVLIAEADRHALAAHPFATVAAAVREALAAEHEVALADLVLIRQGTLPRTSSGKVQRHACRNLYLQGGLATVARGGSGEKPEPVGAARELESAAAEAGPGTAAEAVLRAALARAARVDPRCIDPLRAMTSYGLDSLAAVELRNAVEAELGVALPIAELLEGMSLREAARRTVAAPEVGRATPSVPTAPAGTGEYPLTAGQQALWALYGLDPASAAYHIAGAARLLRPVAPERLDRALRRLCERHPALRTTYSNGPDGPLQRVHPQGAVGLRREDAGVASREELRRRVHEAAFQPFDLAAGPVLRAVLFERGEDPEGSVLLLTVHHIAADFWSAAVLVRELGELCAGAEAAALPALPLAPSDLAVRERRLWADGRLDGRLAEARRELAGAPLLSLPYDRPRPALQTFVGGRRGARLASGLAADLRALAWHHDATLFMVLLAGFQALLSRSGGQEDFLVGTPTSGRSSRELEPLVGYLVNPVPVRANLSGDPPAGPLLMRARHGTLAALARQDLPLPLLAEGLEIERDPSRPAVFQAMLVFQRAPQPDLAALASFALGEGGGRLETGGLWLEALPLEPHSAQLDLTLLVGEIGADLAVTIQFNRDLFDATTAQRLLGHLAGLLAGLAAEDGRRLSELPMLSTAEQHQILREWNATAVAAQPALLHELFAAQAERTPEAPAVVSGDETLTYRELLARSRRLACHLKSCGAGPETLVAVCLERSCELMVALLATLEAGAAWVPLDPSYPAERLAYMLEDSQAFRVITDRRLGATLPIPAGLALWVDPPVVEGGAVSEVAGDARAGAGPDQLAYVIYTSGSTGRPKGVMNSHRAIINRLRWMQGAFGIMPADRVLQKTPISFDVSVWELFWPLITGACLIMARPGGHLDSQYLRDEIAVRRITAVHFVPSLLQLFLEQSGLEACACLRRVVVSGEALPRELAVRFQDRLGRLGVELHNLYGPTEAAVEVTWWPCPAETAGRPVPIGRPIDNTKVVLLDHALRPVPIGVAGELCIGGVQVARGYLRRPDLTAERFIPDPFISDHEEAGARLYRTGDLVRHCPGGELEFLGRIDHQVKVRGVRIELGEVEAALAAHPAVREVVVALTGGGVGPERLAAWVVPAGEIPSGEELRAHLQSRLPETMIPSAWVFLPHLPLSPSGKVDRRALPAPDLAGVATSFVAPRTAEEEILAAIWREVLGRERVGVNDNFFSLGGDSILGIQILSRAAQRGLVLTARQIFRHPTVGELAAVVGRAAGDSGAAAPQAEAATAHLKESGLSERDLQKLMKKLGQTIEV
jgi:amino acid adenylation domain-containing protein